VRRTEEISHTVFKNYSSTCLERLSLKKPISIARLQAEKSAFYCNISMGGGRHMDQARTPTKS